MKKLLSLALILALVATLTTSVFADSVPVVGNRGDADQGTYEDGDTYNEFAADNPTVDVDIVVAAGAYESRYAVDIVYGEIKFNVAASQMVWDVNTMKYVVKESSDTLTKPEDQTITVTNYSDKSVYMSAALETEDVLDDSPMKVTVNYSEEVKKATAGPGGTNGTATTEDITISVETVTGKSWDDVANYFATKLNGNTELKVATVTITISKDDPTP